MRIMIAALAALAALLAVPAAAAPNCASAADVVSILSQRYGESVAMSGASMSGGLLQIWGNDDTGSWTATVSNGEITCIVAQGDGFTVNPRGDPA